MPVFCSGGTSIAGDTASAITPTNLDSLAYEIDELHLPDAEAVDDDDGEGDETPTAGGSGGSECFL